MTANIDTVDYRYEAVASIAHSFLGSEAFDFDCEALHSVVTLVVARAKLVSDGDWLDTRSERGREENASFLKTVEEVAVALSLDSYPRDYRSKFTADFQALLAGSERSYHVDILEAALSFTPTLVVNGVVYHFSEEVEDYAMALREMWLDLGQLLDHWASPESLPERAHSELCACLLRLDVAWAEFEEAYVEGLSVAQQLAKDALAQAVLQNRRLKSAELRRLRGARRGAHHPGIDSDGGLLTSDGGLLGFDALVEPMN